MLAPDLYFFEPEIVGYVKDGVLHLEAKGIEEATFHEIMAATLQEENLPKINFSSAAYRAKRI